MCIACYQFGNSLESELTLSEAGLDGHTELYGVIQDSQKQCVGICFDFYLT